MDNATQHHNLAMMILIGRSLPNGIPWTAEEDKTLIAKERLLWARMTPEEQAESQAQLAAFWDKRGAVRYLTVDSAWGKWAVKLPSQVLIPDSAFGMPSSGFRPWVKGPWDKSEPMQWLWLRGFQVVDVQKHLVTMVIPPHRCMHEADRLMKMLTLRGVKLAPWEADGSPPIGRTAIRTGYDPLTGSAMLEMTYPLKESKK